jgi:beta-glucosidase/6-phospho-beta-glucosidase/beta-galactosidase
MLRRVHDRLDGRDLVVAGWGVSTTDDDWRDELLRDVVAQVESAADDGVPVVGLFHDALLDGYATAGWGTVPGFAGPRGLVTRDRQLKESGRWLSERITGRPAPASLS